MSNPSPAYLMAANPTRPPEIPLAKWRSYSPSYKARLSAFYKKHPGESRQKARGKKVKEHVVRKSKELALINKFAEEQAYKGFKHGARPAEEIAADLTDKIFKQGKGMRWFRLFREHIANLHAQWVKAGRPRKGSPKALNHNLAVDAEDFDMPWPELFYH